MTDKPKRKNDQPIPRRYWWIFGILALVLLYPFPLPYRWYWWLWLEPMAFGLTISGTLVLGSVWFIWRTYRSRKQKTDSILSTPRRYWWVFGILALVLIIGLRFPVKVLHWWELNLLLYRVITLVCIIAMFRFISRYSWKRMIVVVMLVCIVLAGLHIINATFWYLIRDSRAECQTEPYYIMAITKCRVDGSWGGDYISFRYIPIGIEFNTWSNV